MNKIISLLLVSSLFVAGSSYHGSTTGAVTLAGAIIKTKHIDNIKKHKRKDCPVCKGKGWYMSGDGISKVNCGYCEPESGDITVHLRSK
jgi:hypothetical protein